jgi:2-amino-4-hydroxy-6-hydroxymethyldihydropteridine diphosphokinase
LISRRADRLFDTVRTKAIVAVGSNIEPERNVRSAIALVALDHQLLGTSSLGWTEPAGIKEQPLFLNGALLVETDLDEGAFRLYLKKLEDLLGRERYGPKAGPRKIDLDLVVWGRSVVQKDCLEASYIRPFVLELVERFRIDIE